MPYKRYGKRTYRRKYKPTVRRLARAVRSLQIAVEKKHLTNAMGAIALPPGLTSVALAQISQGANSEQRIGNNIRLRASYIQILLRTQDATVMASQYPHEDIRVLVVIARGGTSGFAAGDFAYQQPVNTDKYKVMYDKYTSVSNQFAWNPTSSTLGTAAGSDSKSIRIRMNWGKTLCRNLHFNADGANTIAQNEPYLLFITRLGDIARLDGFYDTIYSDS